MEQGTDEWFEARRGRITASKVGAILGVNPYRTPDDVMRAMVRDYHGAEREFTGNAATEWGAFHEPGALAEYQMESGNAVEPAWFVEHPRYEWLGASPDGYVGDDGLIEIKCPYRLRKGEGEHCSISEQEHYYAQIQTQLWCTGRDWCDFYQWAPHAVSCQRVGFSTQWADDALPVLREFYEKFQDELDNPEHLEPKRITITDPDAVQMAEEYMSLRDQRKQMKARMNELRDRLVEEAAGNPALIGDVKLTRVERSGRVSYKKALKELAPDANLEPYTGDPTSYWRLG